MPSQPPKLPPVAVPMLPNIPRPPATYALSSATPGRTIVKIAASDTRDIGTIIKDNRKPGVILQLPPKVYAATGTVVRLDALPPSVDDFTIETTGAAGSTVIECSETCVVLRGNRNAVRGVEIRGGLSAFGSLRLEFAKVRQIGSVMLADWGACDEFAAHNSQIEGFYYVNCKRIIVMDSQVRSTRGGIGDTDGFVFQELAVFERNRLTGGMFAIRNGYSTGPLRIANNRALEGATLWAWGGSPTVVENNEISEASEVGIWSWGYPGSRVSGNTVSNTIRKSSPSVAIVAGGEISRNKINAADRGIKTASNARVYSNSVLNARESGLYLDGAVDVRAVHNTFSAGSYGAALVKGSNDAIFVNNAFFAPIAVASELPTVFGAASGNCATYGNALPNMPATGAAAGPTPSEQCRAIPATPTDKIAPDFPKTDVTGKPFPKNAVAGAYQ